MLTQKQKDHQKFLKSKEWAVIRVDIVSVRGNKCEICSKSGLLNVHHLTYDRVGGGEEPNDLVVLCKKCHMDEHGLLKKKKKRNPRKTKQERISANAARKLVRVAKSREPFCNVPVTRVETITEFVARGGEINQLECGS